MARQWNGAYCQNLSAVARARYESKGLGIVSYSIDYLTPAVLTLLEERTLHTLAGGRKELYMSDASSTRQRSKFYLIDVLYYPYALPPM